MTDTATTRLGTSAQSLHEPSRRGKALREKSRTTLITRQNLAKEVSDHAPGITPGIAQQLVDVILAEIVAGLRRDGDVTVPNFGRFKVVKRLGRRGVDPQGKAFRSEAKTIVTFKASRALNNLVVDG